MDVSYLCLLGTLFHLSGTASLFHMLTTPQTYIMNSKESQVLRCEFDAEYFNLFDNPVLWKKTQRDEETQLAIFRKISEPFAQRGRFESAFTPSPPRYTFELAVLELTLEDSGNYTCEVYGIDGNTVLASVTHYISVRAPVELTYITNGNETDYLEKPNMLHYSENEPGTLRCISIGGYPPPEMLVYIGDRDITPELRLTHYTQLMGEQGLRLMSTTIERSTHSFFALAEDDGKEVKCLVTVKGLFGEPIETVPIRVNFSPVITCHSSRYFLGDVNVYLRCEVRARPSVKALFWIIDVNGTTVSDAGVVNDAYWTLNKQLGNGVFETRLYIHKATSMMFRGYTLVAENSVAMSTREVHLIQKYKQHRRPSKVKPEDDNSLGHQPESERRSNGLTDSRLSHCAAVRLDSLLLLLCTACALWRVVR